MTTDDPSHELEMDHDHELVLPHAPLQVREQTGTIHVEGVALTCEGLGAGIDLNQRQVAVVQPQNIWVGEVWGELEGHQGHPVQAWAGSRELRVDGLSRTPGYQRESFPWDRSGEDTSTEVPFGTPPAAQFSRDGTPASGIPLAGPGTEGERRFRRDDRGGGVARGRGRGPRR